MTEMSEAVGLQSHCEPSCDSTDFQNISPSSSVTVSPLPSSQPLTKDMINADVSHSPQSDVATDPSSLMVSLDGKSTDGVSAPPKKKKKKRKNHNTTTTSASTDVGRSDLENSNAGSAQPTDTIEQWKQRVQSLRYELSKAHKESAMLKEDLGASIARAKDAEEAETAVNKGLLTARTVITQRDRAIAELNATISILRVEVAQLTDHKRKTDKRLQLLKTVSANLQEAREARDVTERKLNDASSSNGSLAKEIRQLNDQVEAMAMVKQQMAGLEGDVEVITREKEEAILAGRKDSIRSACLGAAGMLICGVTLRAISGPRKEE